MYLKLRWARFFTLAGWNWRLAPPHSGFDSMVDWPGVDSDDDEQHSLLIRICEKTHDALALKHSALWDVHRAYESPQPALFGDGPENTHWAMTWGMATGAHWIEKDAGRYVMTTEV